MKKNKINVFLSKPDLKIKLSDDDVVNIIGVKGSGKTTSTLEYINNDSYIVINSDKLFGLPDDNYEEDKELIKIIKLLTKKYGNLNDIVNYAEVYKDIVNYVKEQKKKCIFEGNIIEDIEPITCVIGTVVIKRTSVLKSYFRAVRRDYKNQYFMEIEIKKHGKLGKFYRLKNILKRRLNIFSQAKNIEKIIDKLIININKNK